MDEKKLYIEMLRDFRSYWPDPKAKEAPEMHFSLWSVIQGKFGAGVYETFRKAFRSYVDGRC